MDSDRNEGRLAESVLRLSWQGGDDWPDGDTLYVCAPVMRICRDNGRKIILAFREGRSPDAYEMACDSMLVSKGCRWSCCAFLEIGNTVEFATMPRRYVRRIDL